MNLKRVLDWRGSVSFGAVLIVALALSWWSLYSLAVSFYGVPQLLAVGVSVAFDGAALFVADLASKYARTEDSGLAVKMATYLFIGASVYLNVEHAVLLGYGVPGMVLFGAPPVIAGILFELYLRFIHRGELRKHGLVAKRMPAFGKLAWIMFFWKTLTGFRKVILYRLNEVVTSVTEPVTVSKRRDKTVMTNDKKNDSFGDTVTAKSKVIVTDVTTDKTVTDGLSRDMTVSLLVRTLVSQGVTDKHDIRDRIRDIKGCDIPLNTVTQNLSRLSRKA